MNADVSYIGIRDGLGDGFKVVPEPFGISQADRRHHLYCIGKTGTGKSTLIRNLLIQDLRAGRGVGLLDPHGDLADELLNYVPRWRTNDVFYFDPADVAWPAGFNLFSKVPKDRRHLVAEHVLSAFAHIWSLSNESTPRLLNLLYNTIAALLENAGTSLLGVYRMLVDDHYRERIVSNISDPHIRQYWEREFPSDTRQRIELTSSTLNKVGRLLSSPVIRNIVGQTRTKLDLSYMVNHERIIICNLSKGRLGEDASNLLGSLLLIQFYVASMNRATVMERPMFHLFVDEFQNFGTSVFADILSESRKYGLALTLAHQFMSQLTTQVRSGVIGNVGSIISFRVGSDDAKVLASEFSEALREIQSYSFTDLELFEIWARIQEDGTARSPFIARTLPPIGDASSRHETILRESRRQFARPQAEVERNIHNWLRH